MLNLLYTEPSFTCACDACICLFGDLAECIRDQDYLDVIDEITAELPSIARKAAATVVLTEHGGPDPSVTVITRHDDLDTWALFGNATIDKIQQQRRTIDILINDAGHGTLIVGSRRFTLEPISETLSCLCARVSSAPRQWITGLTEQDAAFLLAVTASASVVSQPVPGEGADMAVIGLWDTRTDGWSILRSLLVLTAAQREILMDLIESDQPLEDAALAAFLTAR